MDAAKQQEGKSSGTGFWLCVGLLLAVIYVGTYGICRWQDVLLYDVKYWTELEGRSFSGYGVVHNRYVDERGSSQENLGGPAELVFFSLCEIESSVRQLLRRVD